MLRKLVLVLLWLLPFCVLAGTGEDSFTLVKDLKRSLLIYNSDQKNYVPHAYNTPFNENTVSFILDLNENAGLHLRICGPPQSALFVSQKIISTIGSEGCLLLNIDSLQKTYQKKSLFISLYNKNLNLKDVELEVVNLLSSNEINENKETDVVEIVARNTYPFKNFYIVGLLLILSFFAMIKGAYPKIFNEFYSWSKVLTFRWREDSIISSRPISSVNLLFLALYSLTMAFVILSLWFETGGTPQQFDFIQYDGFYATIVSWVLLAVVIFAILILKYVIIYISSSLLGFKELVRFHFLDFIRISQLFLLVSAGPSPL